MGIPEPLSLKKAMEHVNGKYTMLALNMGEEHGVEL
jgi:hypothetical protein